MQIIGHRGHMQGGGVVENSTAAVAVALAQLSRLAPDVRRALVTAPGIPAMAGLNETLARRHLELRAHASVVTSHPRIAELAGDQGCALRCWDVHRLVDARLLEVAGVTGLTVDDPAAMVSVLGNIRSRVPVGAGR